VSLGALRGWLALFITIPAFAAATEFHAFERRRQIAGSDLIVTGEVLGVAAEWNASRTAIVTVAELAIDEVWKGSSPKDRIDVRTYGGRVGNVALEVEGAAVFAPHERVLLFLRRVDGGYSPFGMRFGKLTITGAGPDRIATGSSPPEHGGAAVTPTISVPLVDLHAEVERELSGSGAAP
jgi:hypothetical protein